MANPYQHRKTSDQEHRNDLEKQHRQRAAVESQPDGIEDTDLVLADGPGVIDQFPDHGGADEGDRHRHEDQRLGDATPRNAVGELCREKPEGGRERRDDEKPEHVVAHGFPEFRLPGHLHVIGEPDECATRIAVGQRQPERGKHRIGEIEAEREQCGKQEQPGPYLVGPVDVAAGILAAGREQDPVEKLVGQIEVTYASADADDDGNQALQCRMHPFPPQKAVRMATPAVCRDCRVCNGRRITSAHPRTSGFPKPLPRPVCRRCSRPCRSRRSRRRRRRASGPRHRSGRWWRQEECRSSS
jgi:hypothetical protein